VHGLPLGDMMIVIGTGVVALGIASVRFVRKDIGRSSVGAYGRRGRRSRPFLSYAWTTVFRTTWGSEK
jgi:hypothetical protein